jgi:catechol 2,3-dioxygenase-like lactoylglutathione lyase family enzyme
VLGLILVEEHQFAMVGAGADARVRVQKVRAFMPQPFTALGWVCADLRATMRALAAKGVTFERFGEEQDEMGVWRPPGAPERVGIAWFKDPDGNTLSLAQAV